MTTGTVLAAGGRFATTIIVGLLVLAACTSAATRAPVVTPTASPSITVAPTPATSPVPVMPPSASITPASPPPATTGPAAATPVATALPPSPPPAVSPSITAISAEGLHTCAVTSGGGVKCWGYNQFGQLGNRDTTDSSIPVDVMGLTGGVTAIAAGGWHTCALTGVGGVKCWGRGSSNHLGNGSLSNSLVPVDVSGLASAVSAIAAGGNHACALTSGGGVKCWGSNGNVQLGNGTTTTIILVLVDVSGLASGVSAIAAGGYHTCALTTSGGAKCWGNNESGRLGNGTRTNASVPVDVAGLASGVSAIVAGGYHTCALTGVGGVKCWGPNFYGQLGNGTTTASLVPVEVIGLPGRVRAIAAGGHHTCALMSGGGVKCWGNNGEGQLGNDSRANSAVPVDVSDLASGVSAITAGGGHTCALMSSGGVKCWGWNRFGQLGSGDTTNSSIPVDVMGLGNPDDDPPWLDFNPSLNTVVATVSDRLRVRSHPRVSDDSIKYEPLLPLGTDLLVLDGPVSASGYTWYKVAPTLFVGLNGPGYGWVAKAGTDGEPWIGPAE